MLNLNKIEQEIIKELSVEEEFKHIKWFYDNVGQRLAGTPEERKAAEYLEKILRSYGVDVQVYEFDAYVSFPKDAELRVLEPEQKTIECSCYAQIGSTPPEGIEGELVYVGSGGIKDYEKVDAKGKITLAELSYSPPRPEKVRLAEKFGAIGQIQINWGGTALPLGTVKYVWGNPTPETIDMMPSIPVIGIRKADGEYLKNLCKSQNVRVWLKATAWRGWKKIRNVVAEIKGEKEPEKFVLVNGHYDAWGAATTCNATGNALMLELARVLAKYRKNLKRSIRLAFWSGHETGIMAGSTWYLDNFWNDINKNCIAYMNCDSPGMRDTIYYVPSSTAEAREFHLQTIRDILGEEEAKKAETLESVMGRRPRKVGDQSFFGVGVPSIGGMTVPPPGKPVLGEWYHSVEDTPDKVDLNALAKCTKMYAALIVRLCNSPILPFDFTSVADEFLETLSDLQHKGKGIIDLATLIEKAKALKIEAGKLKEYVENREEENPEETIKLINKCLMALSRFLIPVGYTTVCKYDQDTYGRTGLEKPLPALQPIVELANLNPESSEFKTLKTKLIKERNKVMDALENAIELIRETLARIT